jgi:anti-sigma factor RsiW
MNWNCEQLEERLSDYLDGLLGAAELKGFSGHVAGCDRCAALVAQVGGMVARVHAMAPVEPPFGLEHNILDQTLGPRRTKAAESTWRDWVRLVLQPRFAMGLATIVLSIFVASQALGIEWGKVEMSDLAPGSLYRSANSRAHLIYARSVKFVNDLRVVYEIQTRLEPQPEAQPQPEQRAPGTTESKPDPRRERDLNRADELKKMPILLASIVGTPGRSVR